MSNVSTSKKNSSTLLCSGGKGEVTKEGCLACARSMQQNCGYDYSTVSVLLSEKERTGIHVTDITGCLRKAWYEKTTTQPEYLHARAYLLIGNAMHKYMEVNAEGGEAEREVKAMGIEGTMDIYRDGNIVDLKTSRWITPAKLPYGSHAMQVNIYAEMMRALGHEVKRLFVQYIDMTGPTKCKTCKAMFVPDESGYLSCPRCKREYSAAHAGAELIEIDSYPREEVQEYINERRDILTNSLETGTAPAQEPSFLCDYCAFKNICNPKS